MGLVASVAGTGQESVCLLGLLFLFLKTGGLLELWCGLAHSFLWLSSWQTGGCNKGPPNAD